MSGLVGLENDFRNLKIAKNKEFSGSQNLNNNNISIGKELSFNLNVEIGDTITVMSPAGIQTLVGTLPKQKNFKIVSIFDSGLSDYNENIAYINLETLESFFNKNKEDRFLEFYFKDPKNIEIHKKNLKTQFPDSLVYTWSDMNKSLFSALKVERNVMFIILSLIIIVAAFNIISGLTILVKNKTKEIAILRTLGVSKNSIAKIFFLTGFTIGFLATISGVIFGVLFSYYYRPIQLLLPCFSTLCTMELSRPQL